MMTVRHLVQKSLLQRQIFDSLPMVWFRVPKNLLMMIRILVGEEMFFFWFFPIFVSNHDITFVHLSISKRQPSSRFCEDFLFFIPAASGLMALSKMWEIQIGSQCSSEIMQDGDFLRFFFKLSSQAIFFWPSHLSSPKCLHIRHKDIFILSSLFSEIFESRIAKCAF